MSFCLATFRIGLPTNKQIHRLNQNAIVSLSNDDITREKVETYITNNPNTIFLTPTNATVDIINNHVFDVLFESHTPLTVVTNKFQSQMSVYHNIYDCYYNREQVCNIVCCLYYSFLSNFLIIHMP